jgi:type 1 fimbriae regulatory protein FimB/type 1 fimbriae regulatory protein FimE
MGNVVPIAVRRTVTQPRRFRQREHLLQNEVEKLQEAARKGRWGHRDYTLILILFSHGLRIREALDAHWQQFDLEQGVFHVRRLKGSISGDHNLRGVEIRALRRLQREGPKAADFVFVSERGGPMTTRAVQLLLDRIAKRAGLASLNVHPHTFRHSCGYYLGERGADLRLIQQYLGHTDIRHTVRYVQLSPRRFRGLWDD